MAKNIVIFSDGTGQEGGVGSNTNVYNLFNMIEDRTDEQISFYDRGLGTGWRKIGALTGFGIRENVREAYQFLSEHFSAGDHVYLFGFSRGATTIRTLSGFIALFGILPRSRPELFDKAWLIYKTKNKDKRRDKANAFVQRNHTMWTKVRFIGAWDTVAALGLPIKLIDMALYIFPTFRHKFHDLALADSVEFGRHALAVDDERLAFHPVLWHERSPRQKSPSTESGIPLFSTADVNDIYLVVDELKNRGEAPDENKDENPVSSQIYGELQESTRDLLDGFDRLGDRREPNERKDEVCTAIVEELNILIRNGKEIIDLNDDEMQAKLEKMVMSSATEDCIRKLTTARLASTIERFNRLLLEDAYGLQPRIKQVWFSGMHSDVGGGYPENELGQISLMWMVSEAMDLGLRVYGNHSVDVKPDAGGTMHDSRAALGRLYRKRVRQWKKEENQGRSPLVHESVTKRYAEDSLYEPWILKTDYDVESWPNRLQASIQFDDNMLWRDEFWGWGTKIDPAIPWDKIERISCDDSQRVMTIHMIDGSSKVIRGSLPRGLTALVEQLERKRERRRLQMRNDNQDSQDKKLNRQDKKFKKRFLKIEKNISQLQNGIPPDKRQGNGRKSDK